MGDLKTLQIERLAQTGEGIGVLDGRSVFVEGALPGETVEAALNPSGKALAATLERVVVASPLRRVPACPLAAHCGGCDWLHLAESGQRAAKDEIVRSALEHLGGVSASELTWLPSVAGAHAMGHRCRATLHPCEGGLGFFGRRSHQRVRVERCPALTPRLEALPGRLAADLGSEAAHLEEVRLLESDGQVAVALVLKGEVRPKTLKVAEKWVADHVLAGVVLVGPNSTRLLGHPELADGETWVRPDAFAQANPEVNQTLVEAAVARCGLTGKERVLELYSGNGNFSFSLAAAAREVVAVESSAVSVTLAQKASRARAVKNVRWIQGDALKVARGFAGSESFEVLLLDPPRTGARGIGPVARGLKVARVVYVACDPAALARDVKELTAHGYAPQSVQVFDLFPQTRHVEAVVSLDRVA